MHRQPLLWLALAASCGGGPQKKAQTVPAGAQRRDIRLKHESCDLTSKEAVAVDGNNDGKPEIVTLVRNGRPLCRAVDFNMDGVVDLFVYYDDQGRQRRRESSFDRTGQPSEVAYFENGQLVRKERVTNDEHRVDTWDYYQNGRLVREERDATGEGYVNQWWTFNRPDEPQCAIVVTDNNSDGKPDPTTQADLCAGEPVRGKTAASASPAAAKSAPIKPGGPAGADKKGAP